MLAKFCVFQWLPRGLFSSEAFLLFVLLATVFPGGLRAESPEAKAKEEQSAFSLGQATLGNVFLPAENPAKIPLTCEVAAEEITWTLTDAWGCVAASGSVGKRDAVSSGLRISLPRPGWFLLQARAMAKGNELARAETALALFSSPPPRDPNSPFGVMTHFGQNWADDIIVLFSRMGASTIRDGIDWSRVETKKDQFSFPPEYDRAIASASAQGLETLSILAFGNDLYDRTEGIPAWAAAPYTSEGFAAYTRYCLKVLEHFGDKARLVEIWNEYNGGFARGPAAGQPKVYAEMLKTAYPAIKQKYPGTFVLGCSTVGVPLTWIEEVFQNGGLAAMDGVSIHPYGYEQPPEVVVEKISALKNLIRTYNNGKDKPVWVTEQGYYLIEDGKKGNRSAITELVKAAYLVRSWTIYLSLGVEKIYWYLGKNYDMFASMGLVGSETDAQGRYAPKPAYAAYGVLTRLLEHATFLRQEEGPDGVHCYVFQREREEIRILWATQPQDVSFGSTKPAEFTDLMGNSFPLQPVNGRLNLHLSQLPVYLKGIVSDGIRTSEIRLKSPAIISQDEPVPLQIATGPLAPDGLVLATPCGSIPLTAVPDNTSVREAVLPAKKTTGELWTPFALDRKGQVFFTGIKKLESRPSIRLDPFVQLKDDKTLVVTLKNSSQNQPARFTKAEWSIKDGPHSAPIALDVTVPPQSDLEVELPAPPIVPFTIYPLEISLTRDNGEILHLTTTASYNPVSWHTVPFDKPVAEWGLGKGIELAGVPYEKLEAERSGEADLGGTIQLACDDEYLYIAARIRDDTPFQDYFGFNTWRGDNLQIGVTMEMPWASGEWENVGQEFSLALTPKGPEFFETTGRGGLVPGAKLVVSREGDFTVYRGALPWTAVRGAKPPVQGFSFAVFVNDNDGKGRKGYLRWGNIKALDVYQPCVVQKPKQPTP